MINCQRIKKNLVAFLVGELEENERELFKAHIDICPGCRKELEEIKTVTQAADVFQEDIDEAMATVDWEALPSQISKNVFREEVRPHRESWLTKVSGFLLQPRLKPVYAGLLIGAVLGALVTLMVLRVPQPTDTAETEFFAPQDFLLENVELEMARRDTLDYLQRSQYLLLDFVQSPSERSADFWQSEYAAEQARDLLAKKKYINPQLDRFQLAKAKAICGQIEFLFYELTQISVHLSAEEVNRLQRMIEDKQILLKIDLLKKELEKQHEM
ncbi:MAG: zf-HC2 domain-containing protein [Candidatus Aminicenantes bacterium]|jgi:hypothetical protein